MTLDIGIITARLALFLLAIHILLDTLVANLPELVANLPDGVLP